MHATEKERKREGELREKKDEIEFIDGFSRYNRAYRVDSTMNL